MVFLCFSWLGVWVRGERAVWSWVCREVWVRGERAVWSWLIGNVLMVTLDVPCYYDVRTVLLGLSSGPICCCMNWWWIGREWPACYAHPFQVTGECSFKRSRAFVGCGLVESVLLCVPACVCAHAVLFASKCSCYDLGEHNCKLHLWLILA